MQEQTTQAPVSKGVSHGPAAVLEEWDGIDPRSGYVVGEVVRRRPVLRGPVAGILCARALRGRRACTVSRHCSQGFAPRISKAELRGTGAIAQGRLQRVIVRSAFVILLIDRAVSKIRPRVLRGRRS